MKVSSELAEERRAGAASTRVVVSSIGDVGQPAPDERRHKYKEKLHLMSTFLLKQNGDKFADATWAWLHKTTA